MYAHMSIHQDFNELQSLNVELTRLRKVMKQLNRQKKECEARILQFLEAHDHPGIRLGNTFITTQVRAQPKRIPKPQQVNRCAHVLATYGLEESAEVVVKEMLDAIKGSPEPRAVLKIKTLR